MVWFWVIVLVVIVGAIVVVAAGRGDAMSDVYDDRPDVTLPSGRPLTADDLASVRFSTGVRGYRMDEVDALLARIRAEMLTREGVEPEDDEPTFVAPTPPPWPYSEGRADEDSADEDSADEDRGEPVIAADDPAEDGR